MLDVEAAKLLLPEDDIEYLEEKELDVDVVKLGSDVHVIIHNYQLPAAYAPRTVDLRVILPAGYPASTPDMFWTFPWVKVVSTNADPEGSSEPATYGDDKRWQRWSRHYQEGWRSSIDGLRSYLASIRREIDKGR